MRSLIGNIRGVFSGLRFRLLLLLLLACAPLAALTLDSALKDRREALAEWRSRAEQYIEEIKSEEEALHRETSRLLQEIASDNSVRSLDPDSAKDYLERMARRNPRYSVLGVADTNGDVVERVISGRNYSPRALTNRLHRAASLARPYGFLKHNPGKPPNAQPSVLYWCEVKQEQGPPTGMVFAELPLAQLKSLKPELPHPQAAWIGISTNSNIVFSHPARRELTKGPGLTNILAQSSGFLEAPGPNRAPAYYFVNAYLSRFVAPEMRVILTAPKHVVLASAKAVLRQHLIALGIAVATALVLGWIGSKLLILRPVEVLANSSFRLAAGDLSVRTGLPHSRDELGQLTLAFDQMAQALQQRELDRQRATQKLHLLSQKLVGVQESERRHIARELHDEIGQSLTAAGMNLQAALQMQGSAALERRLEDSIQAVERVLEQVHDLSLNLRPSMLDDLGLEPALRWYTQRQAALTGLRAEFRADVPEERLDPLVETECFRVAQEALTNVVRHSSARSVHVELSRSNGHLHLLVRDDGVGFDVSNLRDKAVRGASLGLLSMEERTSLAGGGLELRSTIGHGTEVHAWFPLKLRSTPSESQSYE